LIIAGVEVISSNSTPNGALNVVFRLSPGIRADRQRIRMEVRAGEAIYVRFRHSVTVLGDHGADYFPTRTQVGLDLHDYARMWDALDGQPLAYKAKDKCVLVRWVESARTNEWNGLNNPRGVQVPITVAV
jgi:hypothetical protein